MGEGGINSGERTAVPLSDMDSAALPPPRQSLAEACAYERQQAQLTYQTDPEFRAGWAVLQASPVWRYLPDDLWPIVYQFWQQTGQYLRWPLLWIAGWCRMDEGPGLEQRWPELVDRVEQIDRASAGRSLWHTSDIPLDEGVVLFFNPYGGWRESVNASVIHHGQLKAQGTYIRAWDLYQRWRAALATDLLFYLPGGYGLDVTHLEFEADLARPFDLAKFARGLRSPALQSLVELDFASEAYYQEWLDHEFSIDSAVYGRFIGGVLDDSSFYVTGYRKLTWLIPRPKACWTRDQMIRWFEHQLAPAFQLAATVDGSEKVVSGLWL